jgi:crotonobetainyl-CoA:carnitine CoA-transferase CaiB-like acyl-CoA transferase
MSHHRKPYRTLDGYIAILPYLDAHWEKFCNLTGRAELVQDPLFVKLADRVRNIDDTYRITGEIMATKTTGEWLKVFDKSGVPIIVVNSLEDLAKDPHLLETGFWQFVDHPTEGRLRMPSFPVNYSATPASIHRHAPRLGEHTVEVLREAGLSVEQIEALTASGAAMTAEQAAGTVAEGGD